MNSSRRSLIIFSLVIGVLIISTVTLALLAKSKEVTLLPEDKPEGIVQRYLIAMQEGDYYQAYNYISFDSSQPIDTYEDWLERIVWPESSMKATWKASLNKSTQDGNKATVEVIVESFQSGSLFQDPVNRQDILFQLVKMDNNWLITSPIYIYWIY